MFRKKQQTPTPYHDRTLWKPVLRCSICNGEQVAGFKNLQTGRFEEIMLVRNEADRQAFMERYGVDEMAKEY